MRLGIDFGTTFSSAALVVGEKLVMVKEPLKLGYSFPSSVALTRRGELVVGQAAENIRRLYPLRYRREFKRDLGQAVPLLLGERQMLPEDLVAEVLRALKREAEQMLNGALTAAVITVPATYDGHKHDLMERAAEAAGFEGRQVTMLEEPVAAALYHARSGGTGPGMADGETMLVYDLGGGTFDAALVRKTAAGYELLGLPKGLPRCGGVDFDREIYKDVKAQCGAALGDLLDPSRRDEEALAARLAVEEFCRDVKHQLSAASEAEARLPVGAAPPIYRLTRDAFNEMIRPLVDGTIEPCRAVLDSAGIESKDVSGVLLVGGSCRIPYVQQVVERELGRPVLWVDEPELAVCQGAALYGAALEEEWEPPRPPRRDVIVSPVPGRGQYTTISEALRHAAPGAQIQVQPGVYREGLVLDKPVEIAGNGPREHIVLSLPDLIYLETQTTEVLGVSSSDVLAAALLAELLLRKRLVLDNDGNIKIGDGTRTGDEILDRALYHYIKYSPCYMKKSSTGSVHRDKARELLRPPLDDEAWEARLIQRGIGAMVETRGWFGRIRHRFRVIDPTPIEELHTQLDTILNSDGGVDERTAVLLTLEEFLFYRFKPLSMRLEKVRASSAIAEVVYNVIQRAKREWNNMGDPFL